MQVKGDSSTTDVTKKWDLNKVNKVTSEDNIIVPVSKGYTASTIAGEKCVSEGFVIKEGRNEEIVNIYGYDDIADFLYQNEGKFICIEGKVRNYGVEIRKIKVKKNRYWQYKC